jgi:dephospho-CoA kinase
MVIGLTGPNASGKGEIARYLMEEGYVYHSLSDVVREEAGIRGLDPTRENLINIGNELRANFGPSVLAERIRKRLTGKDTVDSIRNPYEVMELKKEPHFLLIAVDAPVELRFAWSLQRGRAGDGMTLDAFIEKEERENSLDPSAQQLRECMKLAGLIIINDGDLDDLRKKVEQVLTFSF